MTLLEKILDVLKQEFKLSYIEPRCFSHDDLKLIQSEDYSKIPAIHACLDDEFIWIGSNDDDDPDEDYDETYDYYGIITLPEEYNSLKIYLYRLED